MFDIKWIRENAEAFDAGLRKRGISSGGDVKFASDLIALDEARRSVITQLQEKQARRNTASKEIGKAKGARDEARAAALMAEVAALKDELAKGEDDQRPPGRPSLSLADYVAPADSGLTDTVGLFAVTAGLGLDEIVRRYEAVHDDYNAIMAKALADRLAEALAEMIHERVRRELWGYAPDEALDNDALVAEAYRGIRPAPGYPACPDHTEKGELFRVLGATEAIGLHLTENYAMTPTAAVSGYYFAHPEARYFGMGRIGRDQVEDYAARKGMSVETVERWLASLLGY